MEKIFRFLDRFVGGTEVRAAGIGDVSECVRMAFECLGESGVCVSGDAEERLCGHFREVVESEFGAVYLACRGVRVLGMACCAIGASDVWDSRRMGTVWFLYVRPGYRHHPRTALALMRACFGTILEWGAVRMRIVVDAGNRRLIDRYESKMGFVPEITYRTYAKEMEE